MSAYARPPGWYQEGGRPQYWDGAQWAADGASSVPVPAFYLAAGGSRTNMQVAQAAVPVGGFHAVVPGALNVPSLLRRLSGRALDELILLAVSVPIVAPLIISGVRDGVTQVAHPSAMTLLGLFNGIGIADLLGLVSGALTRALVAAVAVRLAYVVLSWVLLRATPGKRVLGMRTVRADGARAANGSWRRPEPRRAAVLLLPESLVLLVALFVTPVVLLLIVANEAAVLLDGAQRRSLLERVAEARTIVHKAVRRPEARISELA